MFLKLRKSYIPTFVQDLIKMVWCNIKQQKIKTMRLGFWIEMDETTKSSNTAQLQGCAAAAVQAIWCVVVQLLQCWESLREEQLLHVQPMVAVDVRLYHLQQSFTKQRMGENVDPAFNSMERRRKQCFTYNSLQINRTVRDFLFCTSMHQKIAKSLSH